MTVHATTFAAILAMAVVTYLTRIAGMFLAERLRLKGRLGSVRRDSAGNARCRDRADGAGDRLAGDARSSRRSVRRDALAAARDDRGWSDYGRSSARYRVMNPPIKALCETSS